jgi:diguanylate cyclase (GGDEF)-like protein/PAS domain S-box-containing protein
MSFLENFPIAALKADSEGQIFEINRQAQVLLGIFEGSAGGKIHHFIPDFEAARFESFFEEIESNPRLSFRTSLRPSPHLNNPLVTIRGSVTSHRERILTLEHCGACSGGYGKKCDQGAAFESRFETQQIFQNAILDHIQDGVIACGSDGDINLFNRASQEFFGITTSDGLPGNISQLKVYSQDGQPVPVDQSPFTALLSGHTVDETEIMTRTKAGFYHKLLMSGQPMWDQEKNQLGALMFLHNISGQELTRQQLHFLAYHDSLTGLPNRRLFHDLLEQCLKQAHRHSLQVGVLFLDLDNFKDVNDTHGHAVGDQILIKTASCLSQHLRESDIICRWGGDEFVIGLLDSNGRSSILKVAEKLGQAVYNCLHLESHARKISISIGIAIFPDHGPLPDRLIRNADVAMYNAKRRGKNRCELFSLN